MISGKVVFGLLFMRLKDYAEEGLEDGGQSVKICSVLPQFVITIPNYYYTCTRGTSKIHSRQNGRTRIAILAERGPSRLSDPEQVVEAGGTTLAMACRIGSTTTVTRLMMHSLGQGIHWSRTSKAKVAWCR